MHATVRRPCNHPLHAVLTLLTCGLWAFVWIPAAIAGWREHITYRVPPQPLPYQQTQWYVDPVTGQWRTR